MNRRFNITGRCYKFCTASFESENAFVRRYAEELLGMTKSLLYRIRLPC